jgi:Domain of unknown function (DUF4915)
MSVRLAAALLGHREKSMATQSSTARLTPGPTNQHGRDLVVGAPGALASEASEPGPPTKEAPPPLRSVHTSNFPAILQELGISVLVTTYQAGKLVMLRPDGDRLNTHFRGFSKPMGLAVDGDRLAIGTSVEIWEYHNAPAVARCLEPAGSHDACFLPRSSVCTGDIQIHEMAWANSEGGDPELWFVNTAFLKERQHVAAHSPHVARPPARPDPDQKNKPRPQLGQADAGDPGTAPGPDGEFQLGLQHQDADRGAP